MEMEQGESRYGVNVVAVGENRVRVFASSPSASCLPGWLAWARKAAWELPGLELRNFRPTT